MKAKLTPAAKADLRNIWIYTAANWNEDQAEAYSRILNRAIDRLAANPGLGKSLGQIRQGYFKFPAASHLLIYRSAGDTIEVVRILHKSMDVDRHI
jgi:toxin ParE1/3/4